MEYSTRRLYFPYTHEPFRVCTIIEYFQKSSESLEIFGKFRKWFKAVFQQFYDFLTENSWKNLRSCSDIIEKFAYVIETVNVRN